MPAVAAAATESAEARNIFALALPLRPGKLRTWVEIMVSPSAMARLNRRHLGHSGATDVISFGFAPTPHAGVVGDVYLCPDVARANAHAAGCGVREELLRLVVHGTLHVLGWDHPVDRARESSPMWRRQEQLLAGILRHLARPA